MWHLAVDLAFSANLLSWINSVVLQPKPLDQVYCYILFLVGRGHCILTIWVTVSSFVHIVCICCLSIVPFECTCPPLHIPAILRSLKVSMPQKDPGWTTSSPFLSSLSDFFNVLKAHFSYTLMAYSPLLTWLNHLFTYYFSYLLWKWVLHWNFIWSCCVELMWFVRWIPIYSCIFSDIFNNVSMTVIYTVFYAKPIVSEQTAISGFLFIIRRRKSSTTFIGRQDVGSYPAFSVLLFSLFKW